ncbi:MAG: hypothetical protein ABJK59_14345 [Erythrobacter sp.]|uniref:hypothetical protein n=1 Tax=Erythrobacter sp. TaxID=1042 RepID=UPI003296B2BB
MTLPPKLNATVFVLSAFFAHSSVMAQSADDPFVLELETYGGRSVVPPDIVENDVDQERLEGVIGGALLGSYRIDDTRIFGSIGAEVFPTDSLFNRYSFTVGASQDIPLTDRGRVRLRLGGTADHVIGDEGRVFTRGRADSQLIYRHGDGHTSVGRFRYGYRDQSEERFTGFDQTELLGELRHTYRPQGSNTSLSIAAFVLDIDADDDRFSFRGLGVRVLAQTPLSDDFTGFARASYLNRDYEDDFSQAFPLARDDNVWRISSGLERRVSSSLIMFGELGYIDHSSNIPTRDFGGVIGRVGIRAKLD